MGEDNKEIEEIKEMYLMNGDKPIMQINNIQDGDLKYEYNTKYKSRLDKYDVSLCINVSDLVNYQKIYKVFGVNESKIPDKYDMKVSNK